MSVTYDATPHPVRIARQKAGLSIAALAALVDMPPSSIAKIETGHQRLYVDQLVAIADALGTKRWWTLASDVNMRALVPWSPREVR